jgi:hypothetical protein
MKTIQRLDNYNSLRRYEIPSGKDISLAEILANAEWSITNGEIIYTGEGYYASSCYLMQVSPNDETPVVLELVLDNIFEAEDINEFFAFTAVCYSATQNISIDVKLENTSEPISGNSRTLQSGLWGAVRSNSLTVSDDGDTYKVTLTITNHKTDDIRISTPNLVNDTAWNQNPVLLNLKRFMPDFYFEYDGRQTDPIYPMFRWVDVLTDSIADTMLLYSEWFEYDAREVQAGYSKTDLFTKSRLTNHLAVHNENLDWLAQFSGKKLRKQIYVSGNPIISEGDLKSFQQVQLSPAIYGKGAGTQSAIRTALGFVLTGTKSVIISQKAGGDPWTIKLTTLTSESPSSEIILAAVEEARPMGYRIIHEAVEEFNFILGDPQYGLLGEESLGIL